MRTSELSSDTAYDLLFCTDPNTSE